MKIRNNREPVENCCIGDTVHSVLRCGKALFYKRKWPESAVSSASRPS
jgi:hypothetical protein